MRDGEGRGTMGRTKGMEKEEEEARRSALLPFLSSLFLAVHLASRTSLSPNHLICHQSYSPDLSPSPLRFDSLPQYTISPFHEVFGSALHIALLTTYAKGSTFSVLINYSTTSDCSALGWLEAS